MSRTDTHVLWFDDLDAGGTGRVGGKNSSLETEEADVEHRKETEYRKGHPSSEEPQGEGEEEGEGEAEGGEGGGRVE
jgi:hypothetical protein